MSARRARPSCRGRLVAAAALAAACLALPPLARAGSWVDSFLWQEQSYWDGLLAARDKAARQQADPNILPMVRALAQQAAHQVMNLAQIQAYSRVQQDNLRFAVAQRDPARSIATIRQNLDTLARGTVQVRNNLYYLTARCRMASSQALPDPALTREAVAVIGQIQAAQLQLNTLYTDSVAVQAAVAAENDWLRDDFLRYHSDNLIRSIVSVQDSVYCIHNAALDLHLRSL